MRRRFSELPDNPKRLASLRELFGSQFPDVVVVVRTSCHPMIPPFDNYFVFDVSNTTALCIALSRGVRNRVWIKGTHGTGKTSLVLNVAARLRIPVYRLNGDAQLTRSELLGGFVLRNNETVWVDGVVPRAMREGALLLIDEYDSLDPLAVNVLKAVMEDKSQLVLAERGGEVVSAHEDFRVVATTNTWGRGEDGAVYANTLPQSEADRDRFSYFLQQEFLPVDAEEKMLALRFSTLTRSEARAFVDVAGKVRESFKLGASKATLSPRRLLAWAEKYTMFSDVWLAANLTFLNEYPTDTREAVAKLITLVFGNQEGKQDGQS